MAEQTFTNFIKKFGDHPNINYLEALTQNLKLKRYYLPVEINHLLNFNPDLAKKLIQNPNQHLRIFEAELNEMAFEMALDMPSSEILQPIRILLTWDIPNMSLSCIYWRDIGDLVKLGGIIISATAVKPKSRRFECAGEQFLPEVTMEPDGLVDFQILKLQEAPESVFPEEMPIHIELYSEGCLCGLAVPGNRCSVVGVLQTNQYIVDGVAQRQIRLLNVDIETTGAAHSGLVVTTAEESEFRALAATAGKGAVLNIIAHSIAPSLAGFNDMKRAMACLLFGGSHYEQGSRNLCRKGDINVLIMGDHVTAKPELVRFVERVAPNLIYTSAEGSSKAGFTSLFIRDPTDQSFVIEDGAKKLHCRGVACIENFDRICKDDRVTIDDTMGQQQTISIATMLDSHYSVLAAANPAWNNLDYDKSTSYYINSMPDITSRFDMIFVVNNQRRNIETFEEEKDAFQKEYLLYLQSEMPRQWELQSNDEHDDASLASLCDGKAVMSIRKLRKYIAYCRVHCRPELTKSAAVLIENEYLLMENFVTEAGEMATIPVRQKISMYRIAEALAKMRLAQFADEADAREAIRLFRVSTVRSVLSDNRPLTLQLHEHGPGVRPLPMGLRKTFIG